MPPLLPSSIAPPLTDSGCEVDSGPPIPPKTRLTSSLPMIPTETLKNTVSTMASLTLSLLLLFSPLCTDEKHSLYITSMEAYFVEQLCNSNDSFGWQSRGQGHIRAPGKVKHSRRPDPQPAARNAQNKHFRAVGKPDVASSSVQHKNFYMHQPSSHVGDLTYLSGDFSRQFTGQGYNYVPANYIEGKNAMFSNQGT